MRILVVDIAASVGGAMSILKSFYDYVKQNCSEHEWIFFLGDGYLQETDNIKIVCFPEVKKSKLKKIQFDFWKGKKIVKEYKPDIILSLQNIAIFGTKISQVVYLHQSLPFQKEKCFSFLKKEERVYAVYQYIIGIIIKKSLKKADCVITQTNWLKEAVCKKTKINGSKIKVILPPVNNVNVQLNNGFKWNNKKFIYPTSDVIYKNIECLIEASKILKRRGIRDYTIEITVDSSSHEKVDNIKYIGYIEHNKVIQKLFLNTLILPSYIESLCLPLIESRSVSGLVLASNCSFSKEILDKYSNAYFFDPFNPESLANLMEKVIKGEIQRKKVNEQFKVEGSWKKVVELLEDEYRKDSL